MVVGGVFLGKSALILLIANVDPETDPNWETNSTVMSLQSKNSTELLQMAKSDARYASDVDYKKEVDVFQVTDDRGVRILRRDLPKFRATITDAMTAEQLVAVAKALPEYTKFGNKDDGPNAKNLYAAYANARQSMNCYEAEECANGGFADSMAKQSYAELFAVAKLVDDNFHVDLASAKIVSESPVKKVGVPDTGDQNQEDKSATVITLAIAGIAGWPE